MFIDAVFFFILPKSKDKNVTIESANLRFFLPWRVIGRKTIADEMIETRSDKKV